MNNLLKHPQTAQVKPGFLLSTGIFVALLDGSAAVIQYLVNGGKHPWNVFKYITSAVFGKAALKGGAGMIIAGISAHVAIAICWTCLYFILARRFEGLRRQWLLSGMLYGFFVWFIMTKVVIPLTKVVQPPFNLQRAIISCLIIMAAVGLPLSYLMYRRFRKAGRPV